VPAGWYEIWHADGLKTAIDPAGRVVVPKALRDELGLLPGRELEIRAQDGNLVIEPLPTQVKLVRRGKRMVAVPTVRLPALTQDQVRAALEGSRR
jgi:AbrB family looped-hinge helix DNA binding protein